MSESTAVRSKGPDPWVFLSADYPALEMLTLAQITYKLFGHSAMRDAINAGQDLHTRLASRVMGITYDEAVARKKAKDPLLLAMRQSMKPINFGKGGLMGPPKMVLTARKEGVYFCELAGGYQGPAGKQCAAHKRLVTWGKGAGYPIPPTCEVCLGLAKDYGNVYYQEWSEVKEYHGVTVALAESGQPFESFGSGMLRLEDNPNAVSNHFFQNLGAQGAKRAFYLAQRESYADEDSVLFNNARLEVPLHDEWFGEVREAVAHDAALRICQLMQDGLQPYIPDITFKMEPAIMRRWFKGAEAVYGKDGKLKPWWPEKWDWAPDAALMAGDLAA